MQSPPLAHQEAPVSIRGKRVVLRPVTEDDYPTLYSWRVDTQYVATWTTRSRRIPTYGQYLAELEGFLGNGVTLLLVEAGAKEAGGFLRAYDMNLMDGWTWVQIYVTPEQRLRPRAAGEATALFADYLFSMFPLRKLYAEVFAYNRVSLRLCERHSFVECGRIPEHVWYNGKLWDSVLFALTREEWNRLRGRYGFLSVDTESQG